LRSRYSCKPAQTGAPGQPNATTTSESTATAAKSSVRYEIEYL
jgi:hypothetical protein